MTEADEVALDRLASLVPYFDSRRLAYCPYCKCTAAWINSAEFGKHVLQCIQIMQGNEMAIASLRAAVST